ncbi:MAG TPA: hypothetical protein VFH53_10720 [Phycisphaerae bacterium]|nr:hypothetical protein [Phycisphaerae bacterium]
MRRAAAALLLAMVLMSACGCGAQNVLFGGRQGYLFTVSDAVALPGEEVLLRAHLQGGDFLRAQPGYVVRFSRGGEFYKAAETDRDGVAAVSFTPTAPGDYVFRVEPSPNGFPDQPPEPVEAFVLCRRADTPILVVDLDKTVVASGFQQVLVGKPEPMADSVEVMKRLAKDYTVIYLTHRPDFFGPKSKAWLREHEYPRGPLLLSDIGGFLKGSGAFKSAVLGDIRRRFKGGKAVGIGDKVSDVVAYHDHGLRAFLIVQPDETAGAAGLRQLADSLDPLPDAVQVVTGWREIERAVFEAATFPKTALQQRLRKRADELDAASKAATP